MPQLKEVVLNNGKSNETYKPESLDSNGVSLLVKRDLSGQKALESRFTISTRDINGASGGRRIKLKLTIPHLGTRTDASQYVVDTSIIDIEFRYSSVSKTVERTAMVAMLKSLFGSSDAMVTAVLHDMESLY